MQVGLLGGSAVCWLVFLLIVPVPFVMFPCWCSCCSAVVRWEPIVAGSFLFIYFLKKKFINQMKKNKVTWGPCWDFYTSCCWIQYLCLATQTIITSKNFWKVHLIILKFWILVYSFKKKEIVVSMTSRYRSRNVERRLTWRQSNYS